MEIKFPEKKAPKPKVFTHIYEISNFWAERAAARRKCTECKEPIEKGQKCLRFQLFDQCGPHGIRKREPGTPTKKFWVHVKGQFCKKCANNRVLTRYYLNRYLNRESPRHLVSLETSLVEINAKE